MRGKIKSKITKIKSSGKPIKRNKKSTLEKKKIQKEKRDVFFDHHIKLCERSEESLTYIQEPTRVNICHLLDKGRHKSLEDNLDNCIYLTLEEHGRFDQLLYSHRFEDLEKEFKNSWLNTCKKMKNLLSLCKENTVLTRELEKYLNGKT